MAGRDIIEPVQQGKVMPDIFEGSVNDRWIPLA